MDSDPSSVQAQKAKRRTAILARANQVSDQIGQYQRLLNAASRNRWGRLMDSTPLSCEREYRSRIDCLLQERADLYDELRKIF